MLNQCRRQWSVYAEFEANIRARSTPVPKPSPASVSPEKRILHVFFYADDALREVGGWCVCLGVWVGACGRFALAIVSAVAGLRVTRTFEQS